MSNANCGCQNGCSPLHSKGCDNRAACCRTKTHFQQHLEDWTAEIHATELKIRLLKDQFKKRPTSNCDSHKNMSKEAYTTKLTKYNNKIANLKKEIFNLKRSTQGPRLLRGENQTQVGCGTTTCNTCC